MVGIHAEMQKGHNVKWTLKLSDENFDTYTLFVKFSDIRFHKICPAALKLFYAYRQTEQI